MEEPIDQPHDIEDYRSVLGRRIRTIREQRGFSQDQFMRVTGLHRSYISSTERGMRNPTLKNVLIIAAGLGLDASELVRKLPRPWPSPPPPTRRSPTGW